MKKIYTLLVAVGLSWATAGCREMLNPQPIGTLTVDNAFVDFAGTVSAVNGMYNILSGGNLYRGDNVLLYIDYASDDVLASDTKVSSSAYNLIDYFEIPADNAVTFTLWDNLYRIIYRANVITNRVPGLNFPVALSRNSAGGLFTDQFVGEAKFLRAFAYFNLVRLFGDVPLRTTEIKSASEVNIARTPSAQVYAQIIEDLKDAATKLPPSYSGSGTGNERGRPTRWAALAMLADVYLTQRNWAEARNTAGQILTQSGLNLNARYADNFARSGQKNSPESLFEVQFSNGGSAVGTVALGNNYGFIMGPVNESNGGVVSLGAYRPTDNNSPDNEAGFRGGLIQEYEEGDLRRDVNFSRALGTGGIQRWLTIKHHVAGSGAVGQGNFPVYRLAEVMLIYAEAANEAGLLDAQGLEYLNRLRRRAFGLPLTAPAAQRDIAPDLSQSQYRDIVRSERRKELAMENKRWFDLLRYGFDYANTALKVNQKRDGFSRDRMLFPIARIETVNNPLITQNPGY